MDSSSIAPARGLDTSEWSRISALGAEFRIRISYTEIGPKAPLEPDTHASPFHVFRLGPPRAAEVFVNATTCATFDADPNSILVEMDDELMISYRFGPTWPRKEFVLFRYSDGEGAMGFMGEDEVLRWGGYAPTWQLIR